MSALGYALTTIGAIAAARAQDDPNSKLRQQMARLARAAENAPQTQFNLGVDRLQSGLLTGGRQLQDLLAAGGGSRSSITQGLLGLQSGFGQGVQNLAQQQGQAQQQATLNAANILGSAPPVPQQTGGARLLSTGLQMLSQQGGPLAGLFGNNAGSTVSSAGAGMAGSPFTSNPFVPQTQVPMLPQMAQPVMPQQAPMQQAPVQQVPMQQPAQPMLPLQPVQQAAPINYPGPYLNGQAPNMNQYMPPIVPGGGPMVQQPLTDMSQYVPPVTYGQIQPRFGLQAIPSFMRRQYGATGGF